MTTIDRTTDTPRRRWDILEPVKRVSFGRYVGVGAGFIAVSIYLWATQPVFMTWANWENIIRSQSVVAMLAVGMTFVILTGAIDLSVASMTAVSMMAIGLSIEHGAPWWLGVLAGVGAGLGLGLANGLLVGAAKISFFVVTLGTMSIYQSIALLSTSGQTITLFSNQSFTPISDWANGSWGPLPAAPVFVLMMYVLGALILRYTQFGRAVFAVGSNREAARLSGISVAATTIAVFAICGLTAGMGAVIQTGRLTGATPQVDPNLMLAVIAAVLIGGTSFSGGDGSLFGTILGVLFLGLIQNGLTISGVSTFWQGTVSGLVLITAVAIGVVRSGHWGLRRGSKAPTTSPNDSAPMT